MKESTYCTELLIDMWEKKSQTGVLYSRQKSQQHKTFFFLTIRRQEPLSVPHIYKDLIQIQLKGRKRGKEKRGSRNESHSSYSSYLILFIFFSLEKHSGNGSSCDFSRDTMLPSLRVLTKQTNKKSQPNKKQKDIFKMQNFILVLASLTSVKTRKGCLVSFICTHCLRSRAQRFPLRSRMENFPK